MQSDLLYWVWLAQKLGPGSCKLPELLARFDSAYDIYRADDEDITGFDADGNEKLFGLTDKALDQACRIVDFCADHDIEIIPYVSEKYPKRLRRIQDPPTVLYVRGRMPDFDGRLCIAVVGTRKMSEYGRDSAYKIAYELAAAGAVVVSGMALGVDAMAACGALSAKSETVAVFGCGVDRAYPTKHKRLMSKIIGQGCVISEYPPESEPKGFHFPMRNRIISGLCSGTLVVEADEHSGAMITAREAIIQGRHVFALPGNIDNPGSQGTNTLIHDGVIPVRSAADILENYRDLYSGVLSFRKLETVGKRSDFSPSQAKYYGLDYAVSEEASKPTEKPRTAKKIEKKEENTAAEAETVTKAPERESVADKLDEKTRAVYLALKEGEPTRLEELLSCGLSTAQIMAALTILEIRGLAEQRPGGAYMKK